MLPLWARSVSSVLPVSKPSSALPSWWIPSQVGVLTFSAVEYFADVMIREKQKTGWMQRV